MDIFNKQERDLLQQLNQIRLQKLQFTNTNITNPGYGYQTQPIIGFYGGGQAEAGNITVTGGVITNIAITSCGSFYTSNPYVVISGGIYTTPCTATTTITNGSITSINITSGGTGYTVNPTVSSYGGGQAEGICNMDEVLMYGLAGPISLGFVLDSITITNQGCSYTGVPNFVISGGTPFTNAQVTANIAGSLRIGAITAGTDYTSAPTVTFTGGTVIDNTL